MSETTPERNANEAAAADAALNDAPAQGTEATNDEAIELAYEPEAPQEPADSQPVAPVQPSVDAPDAVVAEPAAAEPGEPNETRAYPPTLIEPPAFVVPPQQDTPAEAVVVEEAAVVDDGAASAVAHEDHDLRAQADAKAAAIAAAAAASGAAASATTTAPAAAVQDPSVVSPVGQYERTPQPIFVQAPTPPKNKGNRGIGILIALLSTVAFAILYAGATYLVSLSLNTSVETATESFSLFIGTAVFYVPVIFFFGAFALLVAIVNRGGWWAYVLGAFFVAVIVYFSFIGGSLLAVSAWTMTPAQAGQFIAGLWLNPVAIIAAIAAREVPIWFGAWIAARGRKVTAQNIAARREYDRLLAEGPSITRP